VESNYVTQAEYMVTMMRADRDHAKLSQPVTDIELRKNVYSPVI
jgi:hypothetical protein